MNKHDGGPAYPTPCGTAQVTEHHPGHGDVTRTVDVCTTGMSMRDVFAKAAMQGMLSSGTSAAYEDVAEWAYIQANAMLEARQQ